jgi:hypothetical protein
MSKKRRPQTSSERYDRLKQELASLATRIGFALPGSVQSRFFECTRRNNCRCHDDPSNRHGPYHYWTRTVRGKTVSIGVTDEQLALVREWIENSRTLDHAVKQMQEESLRTFALMSGTAGENRRLPASANARRYR